MTKHHFRHRRRGQLAGQGLTSASIGMLLEQRGLRVRMQKLDPYINVDPGTMSPYQHGEVYVLDDGSETDLDLGHYERFTHSPLTRDSNYTTGQIYLSVINKERRGEFLGKTVQVIPHITNEIKACIRKLAADDVDVVITEIGGTVGDIESQPFLEAIRQFSLDIGKENCLYIHLTLVPYLKAAGELKTKPTQHSVGQLRQIGIQPDILICRTERSHEPRRSREDRPVLQRADRSRDRREGQGLFDLRSAVEPGRQPARRADRRDAGPAGRASWTWTTGATCCTSCAIPSTKSASPWSGKYAEHRDAYKSIYEALDHAGIAHRAQIRIQRIQSEEIEREGPERLLAGYDGLLVPGGFGERGIEGKVEAIRFARERGIPFFGICLGMQCAAIEFARNVVGLAGANSTEFNKDTPHPVICLLDEQKTITDKGGTMRLGAQPAHLTPGSQGRGLLRPADHLRAASAPLRIQQHRTASNSRPTACWSPAPAPTARWSRSSSWQTIPGSWRCNSIPSSNRSRRPLIRCSPASSAPRSSGTSHAARRRSACRTQPTKFCALPCATGSAGTASGMPRGGLHIR